MIPEPSPNEPIDEEVPAADAFEQQLEVGESPSMSENFEPTQASEIAVEPMPEDANPADWQEQRTTALDDEDWDVDR